MYQKRTKREKGGDVMKNNQKSYVAIYMDVLALIMTTFGSILTQYKVIALLIGIITCLILIRLLAKEFGICGVVAGSCVSVILMALMIAQVHKIPSNELEDKIAEDTKMGTLELHTEEVMVEYNDSNGKNKITSDININKNICNSVSLKSVDYDVVLEKYKVQDGNLIFSNIPAGTYDIRIQLEGFSLYSGTMKLRKSELKKNFWHKTINLQSDNDYKEFQILITDSKGEALKEQKCDFQVLNTDYIIKDIISDEKGKLPYTFKLPDNLKFQVNLYYNKKTYCEEYSVNDIENPLKIQFLTPIKEKIQVSESHQPDDVATMVSLPEWIADKDMGIDGKRYGGGIKVSISDWFISTGSSGGKDVISRITVPLDGNDGETIFEGAFVLDQSMYGTKSTGTISILVNNEEVFSTGKIGGNTLSAFPFKVNFGDADALIILTEVHLEGSDFVFGLVAEN